MNDQLEDHPLIKSYIAHNHFGKHIDLKFKIKSAGVVKYEVSVDSNHLATPMAAHGGFIAALLDATVGVGALSLVCINEQIVSTVSLNISFLSAVFQGDRLISTSKVVRQGKRIIFMDAFIVNQDGMEVARASGCLNIYPKEKGGY